MSELTLRNKYAALPNWRRPYGALGSHEEIRAREHGSLCAAILDIMGCASLSRDQIAAAVREEWGACSEQDIGHALRELMIDCKLCRQGDLYVACDEP